MAAWKRMIFFSFGPILSLSASHQTQPYTAAKFQMWLETGFCISFVLWLWVCTRVHFVSFSQSCLQNLFLPSLPTMFSSNYTFLFLSLMFHYWSVKPGAFPRGVRRGFPRGRQRINHAPQLSIVPCLHLQLYIDSTARRVLIGHSVIHSITKSK